MLKRFVRGPVLLFLRHEAWVSGLVAREGRGFFVPFATTAALIGLIMFWGALGMILVMTTVVIVPSMLGASDEVITGSFFILGFGAGMAWWIWAMHWTVAMFALKYGHPGLAERKRANANARLARWRRA